MVTLLINRMVTLLNVAHQKAIVMPEETKAGVLPQVTVMPWGTKGGKPPPGNKNAVTTGEYETLMWDYLDDDEKELFGVMETDPLYQIDITIRELSIRQRRMMKRINNLENGLTEKEKRILKEMKPVKSTFEINDPKTGETKTVPIRKDQLVTVEMRETEYRKIDDILNIEQALTRITNQLVKAIKQKHDIEKSYGEHPLKLEQMQINIEKTKVEITRLSGDTLDNYEDDGFIEALGDAVEVWNDDDDGSTEEA
ncbi:phage terminase small subunit [Virgibacillus halophilus]|uniref:Phage terminase small subunit n=1 Tax=Tigheibacillus halophilus TaxID=361280 RepID=A0ABU5C7W1_9BACI|nr:phage terminase small subunit [Virgibacillus halophilus]